MMLINNSRDSPNAYRHALHDQKLAKIRKMSDIPYDHLLKQGYLHQKSGIEYSPYDISIKKYQAKIDVAPIYGQRSVSNVFNSSQYLQDTSDKTSREQDMLSNVNALVKYLDAQKCFEYSTQVKSLVREMKKLQDENKKLRQKQHEVISLLSSANVFQSPNRENSSNKVNQAVLSSAKNFVDDQEEIQQNNQCNQDGLRKNLFQTFDSTSQISPNQGNKNSQIKSPESNFSNPFSQSSIEEDMINENINKINISSINTQPQQQQQKHKLQHAQNNILKITTNNNNINNNSNIVYKQHNQTKSTKPQQRNKSISLTNRNVPKKMIHIDIKDKKISQVQAHKKVSQIISQQIIQNSQLINSSADFGKQTASFLWRPSCPQSTINQTGKRSGNNNLKVGTKPYTGIKDSLQLYKKSYCKSNSPQRLRNEQMQSKSQPRKVLH